MRRRADKVKEDVPVTDLVRRLGSSLRHTGGRLRGVCPVCKNGEHSEAFSTDGRVYNCFACGSGGDVISLAMSWGEFSFGEAVSWLGFEFGVDLPSRPDSWFEKQSRQDRLRQEIERQRQEVKRRRLFKYFILPALEDVAEEDRERETKLAWKRFKRMPLG